MLSEIKSQDFKILLVNTVPLIKELIGEHFTEEAYKIIETQDNQEAWRLINEQRIDLLIFDTRNTLPNESVSFVKKILNHDYGIELIQLAEFNNKDVLLEALRLGVFDYLINPIIPNHFVERVREAILKRKAHMAQEEIINILHELLKIPYEKSLTQMTQRERLDYIQELVTVASIKKERHW